MHEVTTTLSSTYERSQVLHESVKGWFKGWFRDILDSHGGTFIVEALHMQSSELRCTYLHVHDCTLFSLMHQDDYSYLICL